MATGGAAAATPTPTPPAELHWMSIAELSAAYRAKTLTPTAVVEALLRRVEATEPHLHSFVLVTPQVAVEQAAASTRRTSRPRTSSISTYARRWREFGLSLGSS